MQNAQTLVTQYLEAFNEPDTDRRRELVEALYTPDCTYIDPHVDLQGAAPIDGFIKQTQGIRNVYGFMDAGPEA
jgi:hypothetical protein